MKERKRYKQKNPIETILLLLFSVAVISFLMSLVGFEAQQAAIVNNELETSLITVKNIFSGAGLRFLLGSNLTNFQILEPISLLIVALISISILEHSGLLKTISDNAQKLKPTILTLTLIIISMIFSFIGDYSYLFLMPFAAVLYKEMGKNPAIGIITVFLGLTVGYGAGFIFNYTDYLLGILTEKAAVIEVDKNYKYNLLSTIYIMISSTIILSVVLTYCIQKIIIPKLPKIKKERIDEEKVEDSKQPHIIIPTFVFVMLILLMLYTIIPGMPGSGILLDNEGPNYISKLISENSPFREAFPLILMIIIFITSSVFTKINKIERVDYFKTLIKNFNGFVYIYILMFFMSQLIAVINWTNIGQVIATKLINFISTLQFSGAPLIITLFIITIIISLFIPDLITKWFIMSPLTVPLFMRSNIAPDFTQFIFKAADGIGKLISPTFIYFIIMLGFIQLYDQENNITYLGLMRILSKSILIMAVTWLIVILGWYIIGLPLGSGLFATL